MKILLLFDPFAAQPRTSYSLLSAPPPPPPRTADHPPSHPPSHPRTADPSLHGHGLGLGLGAGHAAAHSVGLAMEPALAMQSTLFAFSHLLV